MDNPSFFRFRGSYNFCLKDDVEYGKINVKYSEVTKMIFDLKNEKPEILPNFKGGEKYLIAKMHFDGVNRILHGTLVLHRTCESI